MTRNYYNDHDPSACEWLRELIKMGQIPDGEVDQRSILDVRPDDLLGFTQCHFFAGIGGWPLALAIAGWDTARPVWTGSPPCQPFSVAGLDLGAEDPRHLAPHFLGLVRACRPPVLFGEQVASAAVFGSTAKKVGGTFDGPPPWAWLDDVSDRLEAAHYAIGASDIPSAGVGAPHERQRTFFGAYDLRSATSRMGDSIGERLERHGGNGRDRDEPGRIRAQSDGSATEASSAGKLADADGGHTSSEREQCGGKFGQQPQDGGTGSLANADSTSGPEHERKPGRRPTQATKDTAVCSGVDRHQLSGPTNGFWGSADWLFGRDGKWRPVEPGTFPLAHGIPGRVGLLRGYGNAINPWAAAAFIEAFDGAMNDEDA